MVLTASFRGVTETTIKVGVTVPDFDALHAAGIPNYQGDHGLAFQAFFDKINAEGGVLGRQIEPEWAHSNLQAIVDGTDNRAYVDGNVSVSQIPSEAMFENPDFQERCMSVFREAYPELERETAYLPTGDQQAAGEPNWIAPIQRACNQTRLFKAIAELAGANLTNDSFRAHHRGARNVNMRRVAAELGVSPIPLYNRIGNKDALLDAMAARIGSEFFLPVDGDEHWTDYVRRWCHCLRERLLAVPDNLLFLRAGRKYLVAAAEPLIEKIRSVGYDRTVEGSCSESTSSPSPRALCCWTCWVATSTSRLVVYGTCSHCS